MVKKPYPFLYFLATPVFLAALITASATILATLLSRADGMIFSSFKSFSSINDAKAYQVATFISSFISLA